MASHTRSKKQRGASLTITKIRRNTTSQSRRLRTKAEGICRMLGPQPFHIRHGTASPSKRLLPKSCTERTLEGTAESPFHSQCRWAEQDAAATGNLLSTMASHTRSKRQRAASLTLTKIRRNTTSQSKRLLHKSLRDRLHVGAPAFSHPAPGPK